ncbi:unnamed protein product [Auanema sp. JU1783]|nr:unnamed protein product [Auanema sp. JU1783]
MSQMESGKRKSLPLSNKENSGNGDEEEPNQLSAFELLPLEIKLKILQYVSDEVSNYSEQILPLEKGE